MKKAIILSMIVCSVYGSCSAVAKLRSKQQSMQQQRMLESLKRVVVQVSSASAKVNELCEILFVVAKNA